MNNYNKKSKRLLLLEKIGKIRLIALLVRRMRDDLSETFKIIDWISNDTKYLFLNLSSNEKIQSRQVLKTKSSNQLYWFSFSFCFSIID